MHYSVNFLLPCAIVVIILIGGCKGVQQSSKNQFNEGYYKVKSANFAGKGYVIINDDSVTVFPFKQSGVDTSSFIQLIFPEKNLKPVLDKGLFVAHSFDLDLLTILFKYRPSVHNFPNQFTTHLNGAAYLGYRSDAYKFAYTKTPLYYKRKIDHFGYSFGGFLGIGATAMNPWVTENNINEEYDGFVISKGISLNLAINAFTFGVALGWDHLSDRNRKFWIYEGKPWTGVTLGLNLN